jgi:hypothetical protein
MLFLSTEIIGLHPTDHGFVPSIANEQIFVSNSY